MLSLPEAERVFERIGRYPNYKIYVAVFEDMIVGTFTLLIMDNLGHMGAPSSVIEYVAVDPAWQSKGVGKWMMRHALRLAALNKSYKAVLSSNMMREKAHKFYGSLGFEKH